MNASPSSSGSESKRRNIPSNCLWLSLASYWFLAWLTFLPRIWRRRCVPPELLWTSTKLHCVTTPPPQKNHHTLHSHRCKIFSPDIMQNNPVKIQYNHTKRPFTLPLCHPYLIYYNSMCISQPFHACYMPHPSYFMTIISNGEEEYKLWSFSLCRFIEPPVASIYNILCSCIPSLHYFFRTTHEVLHLCKLTGTIVVYFHLYDTKRRAGVA
jgi:hypothetical protein